VDLYYHQQVYSSSPYPALSAFPEKQLLLDKLNQKKNIAKTHPTVLVIGAKGRCGQGALELLNSMELKVTPWDMEETKKGGPFKEITQHDIFVNTVLVTSKTPPFLNQETLDENEKLSVICDVSCDPTSDLNPLPIYSELTTWEKPNQVVPTRTGEVQLISVDNLPSLLPRESSEDFSSQLLPHLMDLMTKKKFPDVWRNAFERFQKAFS
jgi:saccharopine dehydrogenase (NAD+, L-lysine-forming)